MAQQVTSNTQSKQVAELIEKTTPMKITDEVLVSEDGINVLRMKDYLANPAKGVGLIAMGFI